MKTKNCTLEIFDTRELTSKEKELLAQQHITYNPHQKLESFLHNNDYIIPSPGIDIHPYRAQYSNKFFAELDLFQHHFHQPVIAITGSVGKTTITHLLAHILNQYNCNTKAAGNIGTPALDLIPLQEKIDMAILEVSSFQLELCTQFAPDLAIWTNLHPNHLDRHHSMNTYFHAKCNILLHQHAHQQALVPFELMPKIKKLSTIDSTIHWFSITTPTKQEFDSLNINQMLFFVEDDIITVYQNQSKTSLISLHQLPRTTFAYNWVILCAALHLLDMPFTNVSQIIQTISLPEHRLEKVTTIHHIDFYNDSKSTTPTSTLAAVKQLQKKPIILLLGGLSKGIDREPLIKALQSYVHTIVCFGAQASQLAHFCSAYGISSYSFETLNDAFNTCIRIVKPGHQILFSPAGSSFDLFNNYQERGDYFKQLVYQYKNNSLS